MKNGENHDDHVIPQPAPRKDSTSGSGCLVGLGLTVLPFVVLAMGASLAGDRLRLPLTVGKETAVLIGIFGIGFVCLLWQWIAFRMGRRPLLGPQWLWALSSAYFVAVAVSTYLATERLAPLSMSDADRWIVPAAAGTVCATFLALTVPLWLSNLPIGRMRALEASGGDLSGPRHSRRFCSPARLGLLTKSKRNELDAAGCLVAMGLLLVIPVVLFCLVLTVILTLSLKNELATAASFSEGWKIFGAWLSKLYQTRVRGFDHGLRSIIPAVFGCGFLYLFAHWVAFLMNWRHRITAPKLWVVSTIYIVVAILGVAVATWPGPRGDQAAVDSDRLSLWLILNLIVSVFGGINLCGTIALWIMSVRSAARSARILAPEGGNFEGR